MGSQKIIVVGKSDKASLEFIVRDGGKILFVTGPVAMMVVTLPVGADISSGIHRDSRCVSWNTSKSTIFLEFVLAPEIKDVGLILIDEAFNEELAADLTPIGGTTVNASATGVGTDALPSL